MSSYTSRGTCGHTNMGQCKVHACFGNTNGFCVCFPGTAGNVSCVRIWVEVCTLQRNPRPLFVTITPQLSLKTRLACCTGSHHTYFVQRTFARPGQSRYQFVQYVQYVQYRQHVQYALYSMYSVYSMYNNMYSMYVCRYVTYVHMYSMCSMYLVQYQMY